MIWLGSLDAKVLELYTQQQISEASCENSTPPRIHSSELSSPSFHAVESSSVNPTQPGLISHFIAFCIFPMLCQPSGLTVFTINT